MRRPPRARPRATTGRAGFIFIARTQKHPVTSVRALRSVARNALDFARRRGAATKRVLRVAGVDLEPNRHLFPEALIPLHVQQQASLVSHAQCHKPALHAQHHGGSTLRRRRGMHIECLGSRRTSRDASEAYCAPGEATRLHPGRHLRSRLCENIRHDAAGRRTIPRSHVNK